MPCPSEASTYIAVSDHIGLALESDSYDCLVQRVKDAVPELLELNNLAKDKSVSLMTETRRLACA